MTRLTVCCQAAARSLLGGAGHTRGAKVCRTCFRLDTSASVRLPADNWYQLASKQLPITREKEVY